MEAEGILWALHPDGTLTRVDLMSGKGTIVHVAAQVREGVADVDGLWVVDRGGALIRLDGAGAVSSKVALPGRPYGVAVGGGSVWVSIEGPA